MAFLTKIRNYIKKYRGRGFRTSIQKEKKQKYLLPQDNNEIPRKKWGIFQKKTNRLSPFSRFIQGKIDTISDITHREQKYMGYIGIFLIITTLYIVIYSSYFDITPSKLLIESTNEGIDISIAYRTVEDLYGKNVFMVNEDSVALSLQKYQKNISHISIDRLYPNGLKVLLSSYPIVFNLKIPQVGSKEWGLSENGVIIPKTQYKTIPKHTLELISDNINEDSFLDYKVLLENEKTKIILKIISFFNENWNDLNVGLIYYLEKESEVHISINQDTRILLTLQEFSQDIKERLLYNHLKLELITLKTYIEKNKPNIMNGSITYIDARIPGKIFICKEKIPCQKNLTLIYGESYK